MTVPHYGKREAGGLTASSPGDTLYFNFGSYNDSGDSEAMTGLAVTDIEVFKNGIATTRATDSGYSLISDTGQVGDRVGLHRFSIQLFNTTDDTGHYDVGGWYQVAVDSVTVDGKTVRFWAGSFEIGRDRVDVRAIDGDTGPADNLGRIAGDTGTGSYIYRESDTGGFADAVWAKDIRTLTAFQFDTGVWGSNASRTLTSFLFDTGVAATVWRSSTSTYTSDTGSVAYAQGRVMAVRNDTGAAHLDQGRFGVLSDSGVAAAVLDTGKVAAAVWTSHATRTLTAFALDTGVRDTIWRASPSSYTSDTGSFGYAAGRVMAVRNDTGAAHLDQGRFGVLSDSGRQAAVLDTGKVAAAVWTSHATRLLSAFAFDTGIAQTVWRESGSTYTDTGSLGYMVDNPPAATVDTGVVNRAVWNADASRTLTAFAFDTGVAHTVWSSSQSAFADTGSFAYAQGRIMKVLGDTGAAHLDQGRFGVLSDSGRMAAVLDTGKVAAAVWTSHATRTLSAFAFDTGIAQTVWRESGSTYTDTGSLGYMVDNPPAASVDTGVVNRAVWVADASRTLTSYPFLDTGVAETVWRYTDTDARMVNVRAIMNDTGAADVLQKFGTKLAADGEIDTGTGDATSKIAVAATATLDTGAVNRAVWNADASRTLTAFAFDTGVAQTVWRESRSTYTDTGSFGFGVNVHELRNDTGAARHLQELADEYDTGRLPAEATASLDTGAVNRAVWNADASRTLTAFAFDTGVAHTVWSSSQSAFADTGSFAYAQGRVMKVLGDTGAAHLDQGRFGVLSDSGRMAAVLDTGKVASAVWTSHATRTLTSYPFLDTGVAETVWRYTDTDARMVNVKAIQNDTGAAAHLQQAMLATGRIAADIRAVLADTGAAHLDQGRFGVLSDSGVAAAVLDTGKVAAAVWTSHATRTLTAFQFDTGVWGSNFSGGRTLTSFLFDTGVAATVWRQSTSSYTSDTGSVAYAQGRLMAVRNDTGAAHLDQGRLGVLADSGVLAAVLDTGKVASAVWTSHATRTLTAFAHDTGVADTVWKYTDTDARTVNVRAIMNDTGAADVLQKFGTKLDADGEMDSGTFDGTNPPVNLDVIGATVWTYGDTGQRSVNVRQLFNDTGAAAHLSQSYTVGQDTGVPAIVAAIKAKTDQLMFDTGGEVQADIRKVNNVTITGTGASGDEWGP